MLFKIKTLLNNKCAIHFMKIIFAPVKYTKELEHSFMENLLNKLGNNKKIGLVTTVQFLDQLKQLTKFLKENGKKVVTGKPNKALEKGQILGCDLSAAISIERNVDCFVYLGSGLFHPLGLGLKTSKQIIIANPLTNEISEISKEQVEFFKNTKKKMLNSFNFAKKIGILVCTKTGQYNLKAALKAKKFLEGKGKKVYIFMFDTLVPEDLINFSDIEAWLNTACPRIAIDDAERIGKPIVNLEDIQGLKL